jgi:hypothetical protein
MASARRRCTATQAHSHAFQNGNKGTDKTKPTENLKIPSPAGTSPSPALKKRKFAASFQIKSTPDLQKSSVIVKQLHKQ